MSLGAVSLSVKVNGVSQSVDGFRQVETATQRLAREVETTSGRMTTATSRMAENHNRQMNSMGSATNRSQSIMTSFEKTVQSVTMRIWNLTMAVGIVVGALVGMSSLADTQTQIASKIKLVTDNMEEQAYLSERLYNLSQKTRSQNEATVELYTRLTRYTKELNLTQEELFRITESVNKSITLSGGSASSAQAAIIQFNQAMASGVLRGEELNSVMEQAPRLAEAIAKGMGVTIGKLREMGKEGQLTSKAVAEALLSQSNSIDSEYGKMTKTVSQSWTVLVNAIGRYVGEKDRATGASASIAEGLINISENMASLDTVTTAGIVTFQAFFGLLGDGVTLISGTGQALKEMVDFLGQVPGLLTPLAVAAYYAVGGITALSAAFTGLTAAIAASMALNPAAWAAGVGVAFYMAAKPAVSALDELIHKYTDLNLTGEAAYREEMQRAAEAEKAWEFQKQKSLFMYKEGGIPLSAGMRKELGIETTSPVSTRPSDEELKRIEDWRKIYADLRTEIANTNPYIDQHQQELNNIANRFDDLMHKKGADISLLKQLRTELTLNVKARHEQAVAIKATSDEFKEYLRQAEAEPPQHNEAGNKSLRWEEELKWLESLQPTAEADALNTQIATLEKMLADMPWLADQVSAAMEKLKEDFSASSGLNDILAKSAELKVALIEDPYEREKGYIKERYDLERTEAEKALKRHEKDAEKRAKIEAYLTDLKAKYIDETTQVDTESLKSRVYLASQYTGMAGQLFAELAASQDQSSREGFESAKAYSLGATIMNTAAAIMNAFATVPWPASVAAAALAGATGAIQIATINSAQFGGGGSVRGVSAGYGGSGNAGSSTVTGRGIGAPTRSISDIQTEESLRHLAESSDRAANAINRVADGLTEIGTLFSEGSRGNAYGSQLATAEGQTGKGALPMTGNGQWSMVAAGSAIGMIGGPLGMAIGAIIGGALNGAFGIGNKWVRNATGVNLGMEDGELTGSLWTRYKKEGGLFRKDKYSVESSPLVREMEDTFNGYLGQIMIAISRSAVALGTRTDFGSTQLSSTQIQTSGRSAEDINKDLEAWFTKAADVLAQTTEGLQEFTFQGESAFDAIIRLAVSLQTVDAELELIGAKILPATLAAGNAAFLLTEMMGGIEEFQDKVGTYFESMFSDEEQDRRRAAAAAREVGVAFAEMNLSVPATKEGFISIVDSLNLSTERGRALFASLMDVSEAFALVQDHAADMAEQQRESARDLESRYLRVTGKGTMADLLDLVNQQQDEYEDYVKRGLDTAKLLQVQQLEYAEAAKEAAETISAAGNELTEAADRLRDKFSTAVSAQISIITTLQGLLGGNLSTLSPEDKYSQTGAAFRSTYGRARLGDVDAMQAVSQLATEFLNASRGYNASGPGYASDFTEVTQALALLGGLPSDTQIQIDVAQQQLENLKKIQESIVDGNTDNIAYLREILGENSGVSMLLEQYLQADAAAKQAVLQAQQEALQRAEAERQRIDFERQRTVDLAALQQSYEASLSDTFTNNILTEEGLAQMKLMAANPTQYPYDPRYDVAATGKGVGIKDGVINGADTSYAAYAIRYQELLPSLKNQATMIAEITAAYEAAQAEINSRQFVPQYAVGTSFLASDQYAQVHAGEAIIDAQSNAVLQKYGIKVQTSGDNEETVTELKNAVTELRALVRLQGEANRQLIAKLAAVEARLAGTQTKSILENAA